MNDRLYRTLRNAILDGSLPAASRLPATRSLAADLGIARNTAIYAYDQLLAEGYTHTRQGSGTFVTETLPDIYPHPDPDRTATPHPAPQTPGLSERGSRIVQGASASPYQWGAFMPGVPDVTAFPHKKFGRIANALWRDPKPAMLSYSYGGGLPALRQALAEHLAITRSVDCTPGQILITEGSHQAIDLTTRILGNHGDTAWIEDPGYWGAQSIFDANGICMKPRPVDRDGMILPTRIRGTAPRFMFVTPSHQYPLGSVMSLSRRRQLLALAHEAGGWIIEDDYDSEFRFSGRPISSLQGLEPNAPVIYLGTFSKTIYPGIRMGYMVLPGSLTGAFQAAIAELYREGHLMTQAALATFISEGHYAAHIRRMRLRYRQRRQVLVDLIRRRLGPEWLHPYSSDAGLHVVLRLPDGMSDVKVVAAAHRRGVLTRPLSRYYLGKKGIEQGLVLGYASVSEHDIITHFEKLHDSLTDVYQHHRPRLNDN